MPSHREGSDAAAKPGARTFLSAATLEGKGIREGETAQNLPLKAFVSFRALSWPSNPYLLVPFVSFYKIRVYRCPSVVEIIRGPWPQYRAGSAHPQTGFSRQPRRPRRGHCANPSPRRLSPERGPPLVTISSPIWAVPA